MKSVDPMVREPPNGTLRKRGMIDGAPWLFRALPFTRRRINNVAGLFIGPRDPTRPPFHAW